MKLFIRRSFSSVEGDNKNEKQQDIIVQQQKTHAMHQIHRGSSNPDEEKYMRWTTKKKIHEMWVDGIRARFWKERLKRLILIRTFCQCRPNPWYTQFQSKRLWMHRRFRVMSTPIRRSRVLHPLFVIFGFFVLSRIRDFELNQMSHVPTRLSVRRDLIR